RGSHLLRRERHKGTGLRVRDLLLRPGWPGEAGRSQQPARRAWRPRASLPSGTRSEVTAMLQPTRTKSRTQHRGSTQGLSWSANAVSFGEYGLKATAHGRLTARQIEAARRTISRYVKRGGKMWIRVFPDKPITQKPIEVRMGSGKGNVEYWVAQIQPGRMIYEIEGVSEEQAREAFRLAAAKLSVTTTFVTRTVR